MPQMQQIFVDKCKKQFFKSEVERPLCYFKGNVTYIIMQHSKFQTNLGRSILAFSDGILCYYYKAEG